MYDKGNEVLQDYGAARFIGIEQKWGGRYLPETKSYAQQTIAHNTITVDETSHFKGIEKESEKNHPVKLFGNINKENLQVVSVMDDKAYGNVKLHRTIYLIMLPGETRPITIDFFRALADAPHQYDLPFNYSGTVVSTNFKYNAFTNTQTTLGSKNGYQFLWKEAEANLKNPFAQFTFLNDKTFYTISSLIGDSAEIYFTRLGANDPDFNLRRDPSYILRKKNKNQTFVNVIEIHGNYSAIAEIASDAISSVSKVEILQDDENYTAGVITLKGKNLFIIQANNTFEIKARHNFNKDGITIEWLGPYYAQFDGNQIK